MNFKFNIDFHLCVYDLISHKSFLFCKFPSILLIFLIQENVYLNNSSRNKKEFFSDGKKSMISCKKRCTLLYSKAKKEIRDKAKSKVLFCDNLSCCLSNDKIQQFFLMKIDSRGILNLFLICMQWTFLTIISMFVVH